MRAQDDAEKGWSGREPRTRAGGAPPPRERWSERPARSPAGRPGSNLTRSSDGTLGTGSEPPSFDVRRSVAPPFIPREGRALFLVDRAAGSPGLRRLPRHCGREDSERLLGDAIREERPRHHRRVQPSKPERTLSDEQNPQTNRAPTPSVRAFSVLDAPSNLGLRPPEPGAVPGAYKLGWALREQGLVSKLAARDDGVVIPPRYRSEWDGRTLRNRDALIRYSRQLADRVRESMAAGGFLVLLGGDCSIILGPMLALRRHGRYGLAFVDGHTDFRHPGNTEALGAAAGEDLALATGRGSPEVTDIDNLRPLVQDQDVFAIGFRPNDEYATEVRQLGIQVVDSLALRERGPTAVAERVVRVMEERPIAGFWIHLDVDVLDSAVMPAVDSPEPDGLTFDELSELLRGLTSSPRAIGMDVSVFDPDLDEEGIGARRLTAALVKGLSR